MSAISERRSPSLNKNKVSLVSCESYDRVKVDEAVEEAFELLGGPESIVEPSSRVFIKANALLPSTPEKCVTTHPEVVRAVVKQVMRVTKKVTIGDCPGGGNASPYLKRVYSRTGLESVAADTGAILNFDTSVREVTVKEGSQLKSITISNSMAQSDVLISLPKFKTHELVGITAAIKNLYGAVPGMTKFAYHSRFNNADDFANLLVDVCIAAAPKFHLVDAIESMQGEGPRQGEKILTGFIAAGQNPFAIDFLLMMLIGKDYHANRALHFAIERGLFSGRSEDIVVVGENPKNLSVSDFRLPLGKEQSAPVPEFLMKKFAKLLTAKPIVSPGICTGCGKCVEICPESAISMEKGHARIKSERCIRCYCCHEICEFDAVSLSKPTLLRLARHFGF